jgi:hypothetical protein
LDTAKRITNGLSMRLFGSRASVRTALTGALVASSVLLAGCPKKLTPKEVECPPATVAAPADAPPPVAELVLTGIVTAAGQKRAIFAKDGYAIVVSEKGLVGSDGAVVDVILSDAVSLRLADGQVKRLPIATELAAVPAAAPAAGAPAGTVAAAPTSAPTAPVGPLTAVEQWRQSVMQGISKGYGVPYEVVLAVALAVTPSDAVDVASAHRGLGWEPIADLAKVRVDRVDVRAGTLRVTGGAVSPEQVAAFKKRFETANPVVTSVKDGQPAPRSDGLLGFEFVIETPLVRGDDVAQVSAPAGLPEPERAARLQPFAEKIAPSAVLGGFEAEVRTAGTRAGFKTFTIGRDPSAMEDGSLGAVSYKVTGSGGLVATVAFLQAIKPPRANLGGVPVVFDPLVVSADGFEATIRVPYLTGKADARETAPPVLMLPQLLNPRWSTAIHVPTAMLQDPFKSAGATP